MKSTRKLLSGVLAFNTALTVSAFALKPDSDKFSGNLNTQRWAASSEGKAKIVQSSGLLNFVVGSAPTNDDFSILELRNNRPGYNENWEVILDATNQLGKGENVGVGLLIYNSADSNDNVNLEFYGAGNRGGFNFIGVTDDNDDPSKDIRANPGVTSGSMRISFSKTSKLFTFWYDGTGPADGYKWTRLCTFSPTGKGGDRNGNWRMNPGGGTFGVQLFGYAERSKVARGKATLDNFVLKTSK